MAKIADEENAFYLVMRVLLLAFLKGSPPIMAVEMGRRAVPGHVRPSFQELETTCRSTGSSTGGNESAAASAGS
jgi:chemotaxis protein MotA